MQLTAELSDVLAPNVHRICLKSERALIRAARPHCNKLKYVVKPPFALIISRPGNYLEEKKIIMKRFRM